MDGAGSIQTLTYLMTRNKIPKTDKLQIHHHNHKVRHPRCVHNKLDWSVYTCLTQLYGGIDMCNLLHKEELHVSALFIGHLQVDK